MPTPEPSAEQLAAWVRDARARTRELVADLPDDKLRVPLLPILNPFLWEIGHVAWFQERWVLRHAAGEPPLLAAGDSLYDSSAVAHDTRWDLALPSREETLAYLDAVARRAVERLRESPPDERDRYFQQLAVFHEDMHGEAFTYTRQTLGYPPPPLSGADPGAIAPAGPLPGDVEVPGGVFPLGSEPASFVFDNEQWRHPVAIAPFAIARAPVTQAEFAAFVEDGGYRRPELWSAEGRAWRDAEGAEHPLYWRRRGGGWERRWFDRWLPLEPHRPVVHVNWFEADAWCRWAGRRLPGEAEWEAAAAGEPGPDGTLAATRRRYPWGGDAPAPERANLDARTLDTADVAACPAGDSAFGCRGLLGNVWEWTADPFLPYPGFSAGPYKEYSEPWFGSRKVLRGGAWATRSRMVTAAYRNYFTPDRRDVFAGFRTCPVRS
jgi:iron(II)-dependent oxidoreductase